MIFCIISRNQKVVQISVDSNNLIEELYRRLAPHISNNKLLYYRNEKLNPDLPIKHYFPYDITKIYLYTKVKQKENMSLPIILIGSYILALILIDKYITLYSPNLFSDIYG